MNKHWYYLLFLLWFSYLIVTSTLLFSNGFLLSRQTQKYNSSCTHINDIICDQTISLCNKADRLALLQKHLENAAGTCLQPKARVILLIIDAFRYDFAVYNKSIKTPLPYQNKMPIITKVLHTNPKTTRLYKSIADPPTTTMQRLKALTTGTLPTFIDAGSNFASHEINEDNLIDQIVKNGYQAVFMGDDTWNGLYPKRFLRNYPFPSFHVWDLDTVDNGVKENLFPELEKTDWHLLIGHFLGVDHCGHRLGPHHPEMERKLIEMNHVIKKVIQNMPDDAILFVVGDHGMTETGDHGGDSANEKATTVFVHSKLVLQPPINDPKTVVKQIDLIPTVAAILGIPAPFSNLGSLIIDTFPLPPVTPTPNWHRLLLSVWSNVQQITNYIQTYAKSSDTFSDEKLQSVFKRYNLLTQMLQNIHTEHQFARFYMRTNEYISYVRALCEELWIEFDAFSISRGLLLISFITIFTFMLVDGIPDPSKTPILSPNFILCALGSTLGTFLLTIVLYMLDLVPNFKNTAFFASGLAAIIVLAAVVVQNFGTIASNWDEFTRMRSYADYISRFVAILSSFMLFSNSYILQEAEIMLYFVVTLVIVKIFDAGVINLVTVKTKNTFVVKKSLKFKLIVLLVGSCVLLRITTFFWKCREEHGCKGSVAKSSNSTQLQWAVAIVVLAAFWTSVKMWLKACGNLVGYSPSVLFARHGPVFMVVFTGAFWASGMKTRIISASQADVMACVVYGVATVGILTLFHRPLCAYVFPRRRDVDGIVVGGGGAASGAEGVSKGDAIPQIFNLVRGLWNAERAKKENEVATQGDVPIVCGLATAYTAPVLVALVYVGVLWCLVLGTAVTPAAVAIFWTAALLLVISAILRYEKANTIDELMETPSTTLLLWFTLSTYAFYASGHQPSFPAIDWDAAFVGTRDIFEYRWIPASLVLLNTFGAQAMFGLALPLLPAAPFSLLGMMPWLGAKKKLDMSRGEMLLYEREKRFMNGVFSLAAKYLMCHVFRVFAIMLSCAVHCRHLMVWNIFAPKFIFEAIGLFVTITFVALGYLLLIRANDAIDQLIKRLNKQNR